MTKKKTAAWMILLLMAEIRETPVEGKVVYLIIYKGFIHPRWLALGFLNHQQYVHRLPTCEDCEDL